MKKSRIISILSVALIVALIVGANVWRSHSVVRDVRVNIDYQGADTLIPPEQVKEMIVAAMPHLYTTRLKQVDLEAVEKAVAASPFFVDCQAGTSIGGAVVLFARQRRPVVRVFTGTAEYYLSDSCHPMPLSPYLVVLAGIVEDALRGGRLATVDVGHDAEVTHSFERDVTLCHVLSSLGLQIEDILYRKSPLPRKGVN